MNKRRQPTKSVSKSPRIKDETAMARFMEEFSWLLSSYQNLDFRSLPNLISTSNKRDRHDVEVISEYISKNPNIHFLVGALPQILDDKTIFPSNEDIASFAHEILGFTVSRWQKKSKYEIIGHVVCSAYKLNDAKLTMLVDALTALVSGNKIAENIIKSKEKRTTNWNEIIRQLSKVKT